MRTPNSRCEICGKERYRKPSELKKASHICCKECRSALYKKYPEIVKNLDKGRAWNKGMSKANGDKLSYGRPRSKETKERIANALRGKRKVEKIEVICKQCGNIFKLLPSAYKRNKGFCSVSCANLHHGKNYKYPTGENNPNWKGGNITKRCQYCDEEYTILQSKKNIQKFCSRDCKNKAQSKYMINTPPMVKYYDTDIELLLEKWLKENGIEYEKQKTIGDISTTDFFIPPNICLYADGDYWHSKSKVESQDKWVNRQLSKNGYKVIRLRGSEIKNGARPDESIFR